MPRRFTHSFRTPALDEFLRQLLFAPPQRRMEQVRRAERLHDQIEPDIAYPLEFIVYRITGYRSDYQLETLLSGADILRDLRLLIDRLSHSVRMPPDADDPVETPARLAARLKVSTRTLTRWRELGLRWRWAVLDDDRRPRLAYPRRAVELFLARHQERVTQAGRFERIDPRQRRRLLERARRIAQDRQVSLHQIATHLARRTGRSVEALRQLLIKHDQQHADDPIFADRTGPLESRDKRLIARAYRMGVSMRTLCSRLRRTRSTILRAVHEARAAELRKLTIDCFVLPTFRRADAGDVYLREESVEKPAGGATAPAGGPAEDLPSPLAAMYGGPALSADQLARLLARMNYLKYRARTLRDGLDRYEPRAGQLDRIEAHLRQAALLRSLIVRACLSLVLATARRHLLSAAESSPGALLDILYQANPVLYRAVDNFDIAGHGTFEAYLTWSLMRHLAALPPAGAGKAHRRDQPQRLAERIIEQARHEGILAPSGSGRGPG